MAKTRNTYRCEVCNKDKARTGFAHQVSADKKRRLSVCADCQKPEPKAKEAEK